MNSKADLILHPIRLRILTAISSYHMTAREISESLPEIPLTTLYRHINALVEGGLVSVVEEKQIRGTIERTFALPAPPSLTAEDMGGMSREECEQAFTVYLSTLMNDAQLYLESHNDRTVYNPIEDGVIISKVQLFLDEDEFNEMSSKILELIMDAARNEPRPGRRRHIFSNLVIPIESKD